MFKTGDWVRVRTHGANNNHVGAKVISVTKDKVTIKPIAHKRLEVVKLSDCRLWKRRCLDLMKRI